MSLPSQFVSITDISPNSAGIACESGAVGKSSVVFSDGITTEQSNFDGGEAREISED